MHPQLAAVFDDAENRYLKSEDLSVLSHYVTSLPDRLDCYQAIRDHELEIMQWVADRLQVEIPHEPQENLERSIKNALLLLRYGAMAMLLDDPNFVKQRLLSWVGPTIQVYGSQAIDSTLYRLLNQRLPQVLNARQLSLLSPILEMTQTALLPPSDSSRQAPIA